MKYAPTSPPARIIAAGRKLFFEHGFENVSTELIVKEAKTSKASLYKYFPTMSAVLIEVVRAEAGNFDLGVPVKCETLEELKKELIQYGVKVMSFLNKSDVLKLAVVMHEEARGHPKIAEKYYQEAYGKSHTNLSEMIAYGQKKKYVGTRLTADELAEQLIGMWEGLKMSKARMGLSKRPFQNPSEWATKCVETLFHNGESM